VNAPLTDTNKIQQEKKNQMLHKIKQVHLLFFVENPPKMFRYQKYDNNTKKWLAKFEYHAS